jgi:acetylornithine deacetylase
LRAGIAGKGYGLARITVTGREAHSAFPQQGASAISIAARLIPSIENGIASNRFDPLFDPPNTTVNIGMIEGGTAKNIIPGRCSFLVEWRPIPSDDQISMIAKLTEAVATAQQLEPRAEISLEILRAEPGFAPGAVGGLQERLAALLPGNPTGISFGSEASRVARIAREVIVIGPGDMHTAHSDRECVPASELELWTDTLGKMLSS